MGVQNLFQSTTEFQNFGVGSVCCLKITEDEASDVKLAKVNVAFQPQTWASCQTRGSRLNLDVDLASFVRRKGCVPISDANLAVSAKRDGCTVL